MPFRGGSTLRINGVSEADYTESLRALVQTGGGKGVNHFCIGEPSTGKTALTRPLLALFGKYAFVKPQVATTFALQGIIGAQALIWNDFRWPHPPLSWGDMLNVLDNEPFNVAVPKVDGQADYYWNSEGRENVIAVLTSNVHVVNVSGNVVNQTETAAWNERFGRNILTFRVAISNPDKRYKRWFQCTRCYADWVLGTDGQPPSTATSDAPPMAEGPELPPAPQSEPETRETKRMRSGPGLNIMPRDVGEASGDVMTAALPEAPVFPIVADPPARGGSAAEPMRDLNLHLKRSGLEATWSEALTCPRTGTWTCELAVGGVVVTTSALGKKAAKRAASLEYLRVRGS